MAEFIEDISPEVINRFFADVTVVIYLHGLFSKIT